MAVEQGRGCGYRKVGGLYLVGAGLGSQCDRLPLPISACGCCGEEPRFNRGIAKINPNLLWGYHHPGGDPLRQCPDVAAGCPICAPPVQAYLMWVGSEYTIESFLAEARAQGISKRIPFVPNDFRLRESWVLLAKPNIIPSGAQGWFPGMPVEKRGYGPGVFAVFRPTQIDLVVDESEMPMEEDAPVSRRVQEALDKGLHVVAVPDDDPDHHSGRRRAPEGSTQEV